MEQGQGSFLDALVFPLTILKGRTFPFTIHVNVARHDVPKLCQSLADVMSEMGLCANYEPHYRDDAALCYYAWHLPFKDKEFGISVSLWLEVGPGRLTGAKVYVTAGQHLEDQESIVLSKEDFKSVLESVDSVYQKAEAIVNGKVPKYYVTSFLRGHFAAKQSVSYGEYCFLASRRHNDGSTITAIVIPAPALTPKLARQRSEQSLFVIKSLLEIVLGGNINIQKAKSEGDCVFTSFPSEEVAYTAAGGIDGQEQVLPEFLPLLDSFARAVLRIVSDDVLAKEPLLANATFAFANGVNVEHISPTLAGIAYFASLASLAEDKRCEGDVICSSCGRLEGHRHRIKGEAASVVAFLEERVFSGIDWDKQAVLKELKHFHHEQRSAFVHGAKLVFKQAMNKSYTGPLCPNEDAPVHPEHRAMDVLRLTKVLARSSLLKLLCLIDNLFEPHFKLASEFVRWKATVSSRYRIGSVSTGLRVPRPAEFPWSKPHNQKGV